VKSWHEEQSVQARKQPVKIVGMTLSRGSDDWHQMHSTFADGVGLRLLCRGRLVAFHRCYPALASALVEQHAQSQHEPRAGL
jgi:hypothetical protein